MTPYSFALNPRNARGGERKLISDLDGKGLSLRSIIDAQLASMKQAELILDSEDDSKSIRVIRMAEHDEFTFVEFGVGRAGLVGTLHQRKGTRVSYAADEHNESLIRGIFVYPSGAHEAYWLSERAGMSTGYSQMESIFLKVLRDKLPDLTTKIEPVADWEAVKAWANMVQVQELRFDAPRAGGSTQAMDVNGYHADVRVTVKPRGLVLNRIVTSSGPDRDTVYGFLSASPLISGSGVTPQSAIGDGWKAQVAFINPAGRQRSFGLATEDKGPTLVYDVGSTSAGQTRAYRPEDKEFAKTCSEFLIDVQTSLPIGQTVAADILTRVL